MLSITRQEQFREVTAVLSELNAWLEVATKFQEASNWEGEADARSQVIKNLNRLDKFWPAGLPTAALEDVRKHSMFSEKHGYRKVLEKDLPVLRATIDGWISRGSESILHMIQGLLHPAIENAAYEHYLNKHYRDAVFNAFVAVFDLIRERTGIDADGASLVGKVFSLENPMLVISQLDTESGRNEQKGFIQLLQGAYLGIRNPKAHTLQTDLSPEVTLQYLVFASLLARRVTESKKVAEFG